MAVARGGRKKRVLSELGADAVLDMEHRRPEDLKGLVLAAAKEGGSRVPSWASWR